MNDKIDYNELADKILKKYHRYDKVQDECYPHTKPIYNMEKINEIYCDHLSEIFKELSEKQSKLNEKDSKFEVIGKEMKEISNIKKEFKEVVKYDKFWR